MELALAKMKYLEAAADCQQAFDNYYSFARPESQLAASDSLVALTKAEEDLAKLLQDQTVAEWLSGFGQLLVDAMIYSGMAKVPEPESDRFSKRVALDLKGEP